MFELNLESRLAWITGSSRGIGSQVALSCAKAGADVVICYNKNKDQAQAILDTVQNEYKRRGLILELDTSNPESCQKAYELIQE